MGGGGGGQYERIVGLVKQALYKSIGKTSLTFNELEGQPNLLPAEEEDYLVDKGELRKRFHLVLKCKDSAWTRWTQEYLKGLRERHTSFGNKYI